MQIRGVNEFQSAPVVAPHARRWSPGALDAIDAIGSGSQGPAQAQNLRDWLGPRDPQRGPRARTPRALPDRRHGRDREVEGRRVGARVARGEERSDRAIRGGRSCTMYDGDRPRSPAVECRNESGAQWVDLRDPYMRGRGVAYMVDTWSTRCSAASAGAPAVDSALRDLCERSVHALPRTAWSRRRWRCRARTDRPPPSAADAASCSGFHPCGRRTIARGVRAR